jgi:Holliday junction resolvase
MNAENDFWNRLSTYDALRRQTMEFFSETHLRLEQIEKCVLKCQESIADLYKYQKRLEILPRESEMLHESFLFALERAKDFIDYWKRNQIGSSAELDLMEKLLATGIDSRYSGKTTAIDVFAKVNDKIVLVQVKATNSDKRTITEEEIRDLLQDSVFFEKYPVMDITFISDRRFEHFFVPIEEIMANLKRKSISLSKSRLEKIINIDFSTFANRLKECSFPIMKFDKVQFESWIDKLE